MSSSNRRAATAGFTLLELLVVLVVLSLMAAVAVTVGGGRDDAVSLQVAARELVILAATAQVAAIEGGRAVTLTLDDGGARIVAVPGGGSVDLPKGAAATLSGLTDPSILFFPDGSSSGGRIELSQAALRMSVAIGWLDGRARLERASDAR